MAVGLERSHGVADERLEVGFVEVVAELREYDQVEATLRPILRHRGVHEVHVPRQPALVSPP